MFQHLRSIANNQQVAISRVFHEANEAFETFSVHHVRLVHQLRHIDLVGRFHDGDLAILRLRSLPSHLVLHYRRCTVARARVFPPIDESAKPPRLNTEKAGIVDNSQGPCCST